MGWHLVKPWGILATLSELVDAAATVTGLGTEAQRLMTEEITPREQVRPYHSASFFKLVVQVIPSAK